jgi:hypothetical protein
MNAGSEVCPRHREEMKRWFESHAGPVIGEFELVRR